MIKIKICCWGFLFILMLSSCSALTPHENFKAHMTNDVGQSIDDPQTWARSDRYIASKTLQNGNIENEYKFRGTCRYFFEFNPESRLVVNWRFEGSVRDCVIAP